MFSNIFGSIGSAIFGEFSIGGISFGKIGRKIGSRAGGYLDDTLNDSSRTQRQQILSPSDLVEIGLTTNDPDTTIPLIYGTMRVGGHILWVSPIETNVNKSDVFSGKWGIFPQRDPHYYTHSVSVAIAVCEGEIDRITNIYANDRLLSSDLVVRVYNGTATQSLDPLIRNDKGDTFPSLHHTAYAVIENVPIDLYQKNLPNFTFDVIKGSQPKIESDIKALCLIPASGEFVYATDLVQADAEFVPTYENVHSASHKADFSLCVEKLTQNYPNLQNVSMVVGWFFDHTNPEHISIKPAVETRTKVTSPLIWSVNTYNRNTAHLVSHYNNSPAYGGTPCDMAVKQGIIALHQAGYKTTFYPFLFGDIVPNNSDGLAAYPWRGRITPVGTDSQKQNGITQFFTEYTAMMLHYANLCKDINDQYSGAIDLFVIGSELKGLTRTKINGTYPAVTALKNLAAQIRAILGNNVKLTYGADWSEGGSFYAPDGTLNFPLDPLWSDTNIDYIGYDWYPPLTDWRDGDMHLDAALANTDRDLNYLTNNIEGGEGYDFYYATHADRIAQMRTPITDGAYNEPWIFRIKDIRSRWLNYHYTRNAQGVRSTVPTAWIPQSKPIIFTEIGCPAVNKGGNRPNLFPDPKSSENAVPPFSNAVRDDFIQRAVLKAYLDYWQADMSNMIDHSRTAIWCVDARPFPLFPARSDVWRDSDLFMTGHWIDGRGGFTTLKDIFTDITKRAGLTINFDDKINQVIDGYVITKNITAHNMLAHLVDLFNLQVINQNDVITITHGEKNALTLNENNIVKIMPPNNNQNNKAQSNSFIVQNVHYDLPASIQTHFLGLDTDGQKTDFKTTIHTDTQGIALSLVLPIAAFTANLKPYISQYLYRLRASQHTLKMLVHHQAINAGDLVSYDNKKYRVTHIHYQNYLMHLSLVLHSNISLPKITPERMNTPQAEYVLSNKIIEYITINNQQYIGLYTASQLKTYHLYQTPINGVQRDYVGVIQPTMIHGVTATDFYNRPVGVIDTDHDLWIILPNGEVLQSLTASDIASGHNQLAIYNVASNLWELISFETAILVDDTLNKYQLSGIIRGLQNTQTAMASPLPQGEKVILFNTAIIAINSNYHYDII